MSGHRKKRYIVSLTLMFASVVSHAYPQADLRAHVLVPIAEVSELANGIEVRSEGGAMRVTALTPQVLHVEITRSHTVVSDGSWLVVPGRVSEKAAIVRRDTTSTVGFTTSAVAVTIGRADSELAVTELGGNPITVDAPSRPIEFHGDTYEIYKTMPMDEHYFGLGDKTGPLDRRNEAFTLQATAAFHFQESTDPLYKSIPFFMGFRAGKSYGILLDSTWRGSVDFGKQLRDTLSFGAEGGAVSYYVLCGPDPKQVVERYAWLTGTIPLPPLWVLGYQQSRHTYRPDSRVREIASRLRVDRIPADAIYLDIFFQDHNRPFTADPKDFPDLMGLIHDLSAQHFHTILITDMHIPVLPHANYVPYDSGIAGDHFVKNPDGTRYVGEVWPGPSMFPDFMQERTREWWGALYRPFYSMGVAGFWNDMNEPSVFNTALRTIPHDTVHHIDEPGMKERDATHREMHNIYGMENSRATYEGLLKLKPDQRPFVLTRSTSAGGQRYAAVWTGDNSSTWNHLRLSTPMLLNLGLSGFSLAGDDIGGFAGSPSPELLTRWIEVGSFNPIDRNHTEEGTNDQEPWVHGEQQEAIRRRYIEERYRLLPYLYTTVEESSRDGLPMMRPLFLEYPHAGIDQRPVDLDAGNEFMLGDDLLIAPPPFGEMVGAYPLVLPTNDWYDYWSGEKVHSSSRDPYHSPMLDPALDTLPVYARAGSILPRQSLIQDTDEKPQGPLQLAVFPGPDCHGELYQDDGKTFAYKQGEFVRLKFRCTVETRTVRIEVSPREGKMTPWWKQIQVTVYDWQSPHATVAIDGVPSPQKPVFDQVHHSVSVTIEDRAAGSMLRLTP